jgi:hypothetical protein
MVKRKQEKQTRPTWGKMLTREELLTLLARLDAKKKEREMSKLSETLKKALAKKQGKPYIEGAENIIIVKQPTKKKKTPPTDKKPPTRSAGRGR